MVIDFPIDREDRLPVGGIQGLSTGLGVYDAQPLMTEDRALSAVDSAPVGSPVPKLPAHVKSLCAQSWSPLRDIEYCRYSAHDC